MKTDIEHERCLYERAVGLFAPLALFVLQHAEQPDLGAERLVAHLAEGNSPEVCPLESTYLLSGRPSKSPFLVAEQLAIDQRFRYYAAVYFYQVKIFFLTNWYNDS